MQGTTREMSTNQVAVWRHLVDAIDHLEQAWQNTQSTGNTHPASTQLPGNIAVALAQAAHSATTAIAGIADTLAVQVDSGGAFQQVACELHHATGTWPTRRQPPRKLAERRGPG